MRRGRGTEDDVEEDVGGGARDGLPRVHHLLLELVEEGVVLLVLARLPLRLAGLFFVSHLNISPITMEMENRIKHQSQVRNWSFVYACNFRENTIMECN
jgi:hypothetical protein